MLIGNYTAKFIGKNIINSLGLTVGHTYSIFIDIEGSYPVSLTVLEDLTEPLDKEIWIPYSNEKSMIRNWEIISSS